jgi:hypothetical protein
MTTQFGHTVHYPHPAATVHAAFVDEQYWTDRLAEVGGPGARLVSLTPEGDRVQVRMVQAIAAADLPDAITKVRPGDLVIPRAETWGPTSATFEANVEGAPARIWGTMALSADATGSALRLDRQVEVGVPLFGGKIEKAIAERLTELFDVEREFTVTWLDQHPAR